MNRHIPCSEGYGDPNLSHRLLEEGQEIPSPPSPGGKLPEKVRALQH